MYRCATRAPRVTRCTILMVLYLDVCASALPRCRTMQYSRTLFPSRCPSGTILLTAYSMVWNCQVSRAGPMLLYGLMLLYPYYSHLYSFSLSLLSVYRLVLWGWGLLTDRVYITLSQPCTPTFYNNNNNNKILNAHR